MDNGNDAPGDVLLEVDDLHMSFGEKEVLKGIGFQVQRGEIFGFIGPNGAGKTTTIRILATLLHPSHGDVWLDGVHVVERPDIIRQRIGYMPDYVGVYPGLTVYEYLEFFAGAYRLRGKRRKGLLDDVLELTDLKKLVETEVQVLSKGMKQRLCLAQTLIHDPDMLILDEPASGLDPRARIEFRALLKELRRMGKTIFLSSHILTELSPICDSVGIIEAGELVTWGKVQDILAEMRHESVGYQVKLVPLNDAPGEDAEAGSDNGAEAGDVTAPAAGAAAAAASVNGRPDVVSALLTHPDVKEAFLDEDTLRFQYVGEERDLHTVFAILTREQVSFTHVERDEGDLETIFMRFTRGEVS